MRAIAVDDEKASLMKIERILRGIPGIDFVAAYKSPAEALAHACEDAADVAFLDVEMPETDGLALSELLMEQNPGLEVIFVTAYEKYALQAYRSNAIGYLLKPVQAEEVRAQAERVLRYRAPRAETRAKAGCVTFGQFAVQTDRGVIAFRTEKAEELLALLLCQRGGALTRDAICELLWPDMEWDRATRNFHTTAYNIRRALGDAGLEGALLRAHDSYRLNPVCFTSDLDVFCAAADQFEKRVYRFDAIEQAVNAYNGPLLAGRDYTWLPDLQAYYERMFEKLSLSLYDKRASGGEADKAEGILYKLLKLDPTCEKACERLVSLYLARGEREAAARVYREFRKKFKQEMGEEPSGRLRGRLHGLL